MRCEHCRALLLVLFFAHRERLFWSACLRAVRRPLALVRICLRLVVPFRSPFRVVIRAVACTRRVRSTAKPPATRLKISGIDLFLGCARFTSASLVPTSTSVVSMPDFVATVTCRIAWPSFSSRIFPSDSRTRRLDRFGWRKILIITARVRANRKASKAVRAKAISQMVVSKFI